MLEGDTVAEKLDEPLYGEGKTNCLKKHLLTILVASAILIIVLIILIVVLTKDDDDDDDEDQGDKPITPKITVLKTDKDFIKPNINFNAEFQLVKSSNGMIGLLVSDQYAQVSNIFFRTENGYLMDSTDGISLLANFMVFFGGSEEFDHYSNIKKFKGLNKYFEKLYTDRANQGYFYKFNYNYKFEESIKLLADSFRHPTFKEDVIKKTIQIINNEFYEGINDQYFLLEDTIRQLSSKDTSFNGFGCGTNATLIPSESSKLSKILKGFHNFINSPEKIFFVLYSNQTISELEEYSKKYLTYKMHQFTDKEIDQNELNKLKQNYQNLKNKEIFDNTLYKHGFYYNSNLKKNLLNIFFYIGEIDFKGLQFNLVEYISYLFNSKSLLNVLKEGDYISNMNQISASLYVQLENNNLITLEFTLTENGVKNLDKVLLIIYKYTDLLKSEGFKKEYFLDFIKLKNSQEINNFDKSTIGQDPFYFFYLVNNYRLFGEDQLLTYGTPTEKNYDQTKLKNYLEKLKFDKSFFAMNTIEDVSLVETIFEEDENKILEFYNSEYIYGKIPDEFNTRIKEESIEGLKFRTVNPYFSNLKEKVTPCYKQKTNNCKELNEFDYKNDNEYSGTKIEDETSYQIDKSSESSIVNSYLEFKFTENENMDDQIAIPILKNYFNHIISEITELNNIYDWEITKSKISLKIKSFTDNTQKIIEDLVVLLKNEPTEINFNYAKNSYKTQLISSDAVSFQNYIFNLGNQLKNREESGFKSSDDIIDNIDFIITFEMFKGVYNSIVNSLNSFTFKIAGNIDANLVQKIHNYLKEKITQNSNSEPSTLKRKLEEKLQTTEAKIINYYEKSKMDREVENGLLMMFEINESYQKYMDALTGCLESIFWVHLRYEKSDAYKPVIEYKNSILYIYLQSNYKEIPQMEDDLNSVLLGMIKGDIKCENYVDIVDSYELKGNNIEEKTPDYLFNNWIKGKQVNLRNLRKSKLGEEKEGEGEEEEYDPYAQIDECESTYNPEGWSTCKGKATYTDEWTCCYFKGKRPNVANESYCADVWTTDLESLERRREVEKNITKGNYEAWDDYQAPFYLKNMICSDEDLDKLPSTFEGFMEEISPIFVNPIRYTILMVRKDISDDDYNKMFEDRKNNNKKYILNEKIEIEYTQEININNK